MSYDSNVMPYPVREQFPDLTFMLVEDRGSSFAKYHWIVIMSDGYKIATWKCSRTLISNALENDSVLEYLCEKIRKKWQYTSIGIMSYTGG